MKKFPFLILGAVTAVLLLLSLNSIPARAIVCPDPDLPCEPTPPPTKTPTPAPTNVPSPTATPGGTSSDADGDGIPDSQDNCPNHVNPGQSDYPDGDGQGNVCDPDDDNDSVPDSLDYCSLNAGPIETDGCPAHAQGSTTTGCTFVFTTFPGLDGTVLSGLGLLNVPTTGYYDLFYSNEGVRYNLTGLNWDVTGSEFKTADDNGVPKDISFDVANVAYHPDPALTGIFQQYPLYEQIIQLPYEATVTLAPHNWGGIKVDIELYCQIPFSPNIQEYTQSGLSLYQSTGLMNLVSVTNNNAWDRIIEYQPTKAYSGQWVSGDWDGDGFKTPGVHDGGTFYFTNDLGVTDNWQAIWLGLTDKPLVAGRFDLYSYNDCIGVINDSIQPGTGDTRFALNYWCDMETAPGAGELLTQFLAAPLPDSQGVAGTHQFAAGDWDGDGVDTIAVRRDDKITFTNVHPSAGAAQYANSQYWGTPSGASGEGMFVPGDWDDDGFDSWGVLYNDSQFYYRDDISWNPGSYLQKTLSISLDPYQNLSSWGGQ